MALEILEFAVYRTPCAEFDFDGWSAYHWKYLNWYMFDWREMEFFF